MIRQGAPVVHKINENEQSAAVHKNLALSSEPKPKSATSAVSTPRRALGNIRNLGSHVTTPRPSKMTRPPFAKSTSLQPKKMTFHVLEVPSPENEAVEKSEQKVEKAVVSSESLVSLPPTDLDNAADAEVKSILEKSVSDESDSWTEYPPVENMPMNTSGWMLSPKQLEDWDEIPPVEEPFMGGNVEEEVSDLVVPETKLIHGLSSVVAQIAGNLWKSLQVEGKPATETPIEDSNQNESVNEEDILETVGSFDDFVPQQTSTFEKYPLNESVDARFEFF